MRASIHILVYVSFFVPGLLRAADEPQLTTAAGVIEKIEKDTVTIKHRTAEGKFDKNLVLKLTGTSTLSLLSVQNRAEKKVLVQKTIDAKHLVEHQKISVIYANADHELILLSAVVQSN